MAGTTDAGEIPVPKRNRHALNDIPEPLKQIIIQTKALGGMPAKARADRGLDELYEAGRAKLVKFCVETMDDSCEHEIRSIMFLPELEDMEGWEARAKKYRAPKIPHNWNAESLTTAFITINDNLEEITSVLIQTEPILDTWLDHEKRMKSRIKAIIPNEKEWEAQSIYDVWYPAEAYLRVRRLAEIVATYKLLKQNNEMSFAIISRVGTVNIDAPSGALSRYGDAGARPASDAPSNRPATVSEFSSLSGGAKPSGLP